MNVRNLEKIQDKWLLFQRFATSIVDLKYPLSRPGSVKFSILNFKIKTVSKLILTARKKIEKRKKANKNKMVNSICPIFRADIIRLQRRLKK